MDQLKHYARLAKERMKNGFWTNTKAQLEHTREVAATVGLDATKVAHQQRERITSMINTPEQYIEDEQFYAKVVDILSSQGTVTNPLMLLADKQLVDNMSPYDKQAYFLKLSTRYQQAVDRYNITSKLSQL